MVATPEMTHFAEEMRFFTDLSGCGSHILQAYRDGGPGDLWSGGSPVSESACLWVLSVDLDVGTGSLSLGPRQQNLGRNQNGSF